MKIENLQVGMEFKNWKALCEALEVESKPSGNSRDAQAKQFKKYFDWTKQGQRITITEIKKNYNLSLNNNNITKDNNVVFSESETLSMYDSIVNQIQGNSLRDLIAKSIINQLYLELTELGQVGFRDAWFATDAKLYKATGMISDSHYYAIRNPKRFCNEVNDLTEDNLEEVLDHIKVNGEWLNKQRSRVLKYLANDLHLITYYQNAYFLIMRTTRIRNGKAYTDEEYYYPTLDELEWINKDVIPSVMREHKDKNGNEYTSMQKIKYDNKDKEFYQEWVPEYINRKLPTGWGYVTGIYKCHRIGFSQKIIEQAVQTNMKLLADEKATLDKIAQCTLEETRKQVTDNRDKQCEKRHDQAVRGTMRYDDETTREIRCRESYIGVGYVVNRECHSNKSSYTDFTKYNKQNKGKTIISKVEQN